jgi:hypothetical protein
VMVAWGMSASRTVAICIIGLANKLQGKASHKQKIQILNNIPYQSVVALRFNCS